MRSLAPPPRPILFLMLLAALVGAAAEVVRAQEGTPATQERVYTREEVGTPAVIVSMPEPVYHNSGEKLLDLTGTVKISVVLSASGRVREVQLLEGLSQNQNFASLKAARRIRFMPATKDGVPVSQSYVATYGFKVTNQEVGTTDELEGLTRFYVDAGGNREALGEIAAELSKLLPQLVLIDRPEYAECILKFDTYRRTELSETPGGRDGVPLKVDYGRGWVIKPVAADKQRVLMYYKGDKSSFVESAPTATFVRAFVYEYKRANNPGQ
jgi:TonB family protein